MALEKLTIRREIRPGEFAAYFTAKFNPKQLSFSTRSRWPAAYTNSNKPARQATGSDGATLTLELFFDSYGEIPVVNVKDSIDQLRNLTVVDRTLNLRRPPKCLLLWGFFGAAKGLLFTGVLESIQETYTLFLPDGTPVRATAQCSFVELQEPTEQSASPTPTSEISAATVQVGETLSSIAAQTYGDPGAWRSIANANNIDDPLALSAGLALIIPPLTGGSS